MSIREEAEATIQKAKEMEEENRPVLNYGELLSKMSNPDLLVKPQDLKPIERTHNIFYWHGFHVVYGLAKAGKTRAVLEILNEVDTDVIWLDGDVNTKSMVDRFPKVIHLAPLDADKYLDSWIDAGIDLEGRVFIIDSFKDFSDGLDVDGNTQSDKALKRIKKLKTLTNATVIVIHHATERFDNNGKFVGAKLKGNSQSFKSNTDITYLFTRTQDDSKPTFEAVASRVDEVPNGMKFENTPGLGWTTTIKIGDKNGSYNHSTAL